MSRLTLKVALGGELFRAKQAICPTGAEVEPLGGVCPDCERPNQKKAALGDVTQYGFAWDTHKTIFRCKCGCVFFHEYRIWHADESESEI